MSSKKQKFQGTRIIFSALFLPIFTLIIFAVVILPSSAFAVNLPSSAYCGSPGTSFGLSSGSTAKTDTIIKSITCLIEQSVIPFLFAIASVVFIWGMVKFINTQESAEREKGKQFMLWGVIALAVMFCVWGLVNVLGNTFSVKSVIPQLGQ